MATSEAGRPANERDLGPGRDEARRPEDALREREAQYRGIFEATTDGLVINDLDGNIVEVNAAMCRMHGYTRDEFLRLHPTAFIHPDYHQVFAAYIHTVRSGGQFRTRAVDLRKDGTPLHVAVHGAAFTYQGQRHILGVVRDVTEQVQAFELLEQRVAERTRELTTLLEIAHHVASTLELPDLLGLILDKLRHVADYTGAAITILRGDKLTILDSRGPGGREGAVIGLDFPLARLGEIWERIGRGEPVLVDDVRTEGPLSAAYREAVGEHLETTFRYARSWLAVPLTYKDRVMGMLTLSRAEPGSYTARHAQLVTAVANQAAVAMENARLFAEAQGKAALEERQRLARDLHDSVSQTLFSAGLIAEVLPRLWSRDQRQGERRLEELRQLTRGALAEMRMLLLELRPGSLVEVGLGELVRQLAEATTGRARLPVEALVEGTPRPLPPEAQVALYRIAQEALNNVVKHAQSDSATVRLSYLDGAVSLEICDNGRGFAQSPRSAEHLGLRIMEERAASAGGRLVVRSERGRGTTVTAVWPEPASPQSASASA